ncbi:type II secretion system GspH family protein [Patescibacteria group bacterium]|nr:type II secretion system GspH family protein [Patescibacteria group bacterium]MBU1703033.1 type II secretion system GspH family protein [Patescibacteria group bacterium]MBU1953919.1 type II secretion system GspH family protein [Patescibacteria group bacterium]
MAERKAFTLIEMLVVISIVAILAMLAIFSYGVARQQARRDIAIDSMVSALRSQQGLAKTGRVGAGEDGKTSCYGMLFSVDEPFVQTVQYEYVPVGDVKADYCDLKQEDLSAFQTIEDFQVLGIDKSGLEEKSVLVLFKPPFANVLIGDDVFGEPARPKEGESEIVFTIGLKGDEVTRSFRMDLASGLIERIYENQK